MVRNGMARYALLVATTLVGTPTAVLATCPDPDPRAPIPDIGLREVVSGLSQPVDITHDGSNRLFVVEQAGTIRIVEDGKLLKQPFLDISARVTSGGEMGLLGLAFHPRYRDNGQFFVNYTTDRGGLRTHVARFMRIDARRADPDSEKVLLAFEQPYRNHNGGQLAFGPDGYLYIATGDGGSANDPQDNGQDLSTLLGKILRIDVDKRSSSLLYAIPHDNPFVNKPKARGEIWAYGLRNPWRMSFDAGNGRLYAADVGQNAVEEINVITKGGNYGWRITEGDICTPGVSENCDRRGLEPPIHVYHHPEGFSITGGYVYRGKGYPGLCGVYLFADYVTQRVWGLRYDGKQVTAQRELVGAEFISRVLGRLRLGALQISSFGQGADLELYVAAHQTGRLFKVVQPD